MPSNRAVQRRPLDPSKFRDPRLTAKGQDRAVVALTRLRCVWFNTGSLCNLNCHGCYMESGPTNDRLPFLSATEVRTYLDEIAACGLPVEEIGLTGGEPFMNKDILAILEDALERGFRVLVLTNAMQPFRFRREAVKALNERFPGRLTLRVSIDHPSPEGHEANRGDGSWDKMLENIRWMAGNGLSLAVAARTGWGEAPDVLRAGYAALFAHLGIPIDVTDPRRLVLFPEMDATQDVPEVSVQCWDILGVAPDSMMCATSRMVIKRKGADRPVVVPCTLLPYDPRFELGSELAGSAQAVSLNHPHCASFCALGRGACSV
ncbi:MAG: radical SAM protein [Magnetospirillum sp. WYHS-4]